MKTKFKTSGLKILTKTMALFMVILAFNCTQDDLAEQDLLVATNLSSSSVELSYNSITASAQQSANPIGNIDDNSLSSRWSGNGRATNVIVDFGQAVTIDYVNMAFYKGNQRRASFTYWSSSNGNSWTYRGKKTSSGNTTAPEQFDLSNMTARYFRIKFQGNNLNSWNSVFDLKIFGSGSNSGGGGGGGTPTTGQFTLNNIQIETASCSQSDSDDSTDSEDATNSSFQNTSYYSKSGATYKLTSCADKGKRTEWKQKSGQEKALTTSRTMSYTANIKGIPDDGVTIAQLHNRGGAGRPIIRIEISPSNRIEFVNAESPVKSTQRFRKTGNAGPTYSAGTDLDVKISVSNNSVTCTVVTTNGSITRTYSKGNSNGDLKLYDAWFSNSSIRDGFYFKAGVYNDSGNGSDKPNSTFKSFVIN